MPESNIFFAIKNPKAVNAILGFRINIHQSVDFFISVNTKNI